MFQIKKYSFSLQFLLNSNKHIIKFTFQKIYITKTFKHFKRKVKSLQINQMTQPLKKVGLYRLMRCIGKGATSQVFEATKQSDPQKYAIKMIRLNKITQKQKQMITKQLSLIKSISHPHIVKLHDSLQTANNYYLVFEFCQKGDLEKYLKKHYGPQIPQEAVQKIIFCIGDAVREIHLKGIVHRDIKLANILLKKQHTSLVIKLADFGFAKEVNEKQFMLKTYCGTPITMAPQILQNQYYDKKCDIWSLGVIMFQLVYGKLPFSTNQGYIKFVQRVIKEPLKIPTQPQMPQQFKELLLKCLEKRPQKRYGIEEFMASEWILQGKDKKLEERKQKVENQLTQLVKQISDEQVNNDIEQEIKQKVQIIEINTAQKLYKLLKNQIQKIIENHSQTRDQILESIQKTISSQNSQTVKVQYEKLQKLLYFLDFKYLSFVKDLKITVTKQSSQIQIKPQDIKNLQIPIYIYILRGKGSQQKHPQNMIFGEIIANFLKKLTELQNDSLQKRRERFQLIQKFLSMFRRFQLSVDIVFSHHYERQQIGLQNVLKQFKQMGKHISESTIQEPLQKQQGEYNQGIETDEKLEKYDKLSNFITISIECKQKDQKLKEYRQKLKQTCYKAIDQISKAIQGYYN